MPDHNTVPNTPTDQDWLRLSPVAILFFIAKSLKHIFDQAVYLLVSFAAGYRYLKNHPLTFFIVFLVVAGAFLSNAILSFLFYRYRLSKDQIEIRSGIFFKKHINLPYERVQNVKLEQPVYYRMTGFACLLLDTAGSKNVEARVVALPLAIAQDMKNQILSFQKNTHEKRSNENGTESTGSNTIHEEDETLLNERSLRDLVIHGISSNRIWIFLGMLAPFYQGLTDKIFTFLKALGLDLEQIFDLANNPWWKIGIFALSLALAVILLMTLFSILGSILSFYGFALTRRGDSFIRRCGLLTKHEVHMKLARLQMIVRDQDWPDRLLGRHNLKYDQVNAKRNNADPASLGDKIVVPSVTTEQCQALTDNVYPDNQMGTLEFTPISKRFILRYVGYLVFPGFSLAAGTLIAVGQGKLAALLLVPALLLTGLIILRWKRWGYGRDANYIYVRQGIFGVDLYCAPIYKIQQTTFNQSLLQKRHNLCSIDLVFASQELSVPYMSKKEGLDLINQALFDVESTKRSWM
jgi:putative membrane protein